MSRPRARPRCPEEAGVIPERGTGAQPISSIRGVESAVYRAACRFPTLLKIGRVSSRRELSARVGLASRDMRAPGRVSRMFSLSSTSSGVRLPQKRLRGILRHQSESIVASGLAFRGGKSKTRANHSICPSKRCTDAEPVVGAERATIVRSLGVRHFDGPPSRSFLAQRSSPRRAGAHRRLDISSNSRSGLEDASPRRM